MEVPLLPRVVCVMLEPIVTKQQRFARVVPRILSKFCNRTPAVPIALRSPPLLAIKTQPNVIASVATT